MKGIIYPFPVLNEESLDYENSESYVTELQRVSKTKIIVTHKLAADTLVGSLVLGQNACFFCTVSVRSTIFRTTQTVNPEQVKDLNGTLVAEQEIEVPSFRWNPEIFIGTGVVLLKDKKISDAKAQGVSQFFDNDEVIYFPQYSRIAFGAWKRSFNMSALFHIHSDENIESGTFKTEVNRGNHFEISIAMHPALYDEVEADRESNVRAHILCSSLTQALQELYTTQMIEPEDREEEDNRFLELAEGLKIFLVSQEIPTWEDRDFSPTYSASRCYKVLAANPK